MSLALTLARWAVRILPDHRRAWGEAMAAEVAAIDDPRDATLFAAGCLWAAFSERMTFVKAFVFAGRLGVALVTALYGLSFLYFLSNYLLGKATAENAHLAFLIPWQLAMGLTHLAAAGFLVFWRPKPFLWACATCALSALPLFAIGVAAKVAGKVLQDYPVVAFGWPLIPLAMLMGAAWLFARLEQEPKKPAMA